MTALPASASLTQNSSNFNHVSQLRVHQDSECEIHFSHISAVAANLDVKTTTFESKHQMKTLHHFKDFTIDNHTFNHEGKRLESDAALQGSYNFVIFDIRNVR